MQTGWAITVWPKVFVEAQHHAVWRDAEGVLRDVTPSDDGPTTLFIADDDATYDASKYHGRPNIRVPLRDEKTLRTYLDRSAEVVALKLRSAGPVLQVDDELQMALAAQMLSHQEVLAKYLSPNDRCFCGSRVKYKKCHMGRHPPFRSPQFVSFLRALTSV